jgi:hypothetical protein
MTTRPGSTLHPPSGAVVLLVGLALAAFATAPAQAAAPAAPARATFALTAAGKTGALRLRGSAGRTVHGTVLVRNLSARAVSVRLQRADVRNASNGNADYATTRPSAAGRWVTLATRTVRLAPKAARRIAFAVHVPAGTSGAKHYAGIVAVDAADLVRAARNRTRAGTSSFTISRISRQALPITIRLPGPLSRSLVLRSLKLVVAPAGAGLVLGLRPVGTTLIESAPIRLRVSRGARTILTHASTLGQLFPDDSFDFRIPWVGRPTEGSYRVRGVIRPRAAAPVYIDQRITFTSAKADELTRVTPPIAGPTASSGLPTWVWLAFGGGAGLLLALLLTVWWLARRNRRDPDDEPGPDPGSDPEPLGGPPLILAARRRRDDEDEHEDERVTVPPDQLPLPRG